eukprot:TRINITY_DN1523_c0_g1_i1.p1 TRINITY_DN1523_c0_g1~~TRINITY_DN1523_c0_g1_i1.p1  ORF type:complete len:199 (-),score=24.32 TRINITY_DN1523_c0_g1_i1:90-686(-)
MAVRPKTVILAVFILLALVAAFKMGENLKVNSVTSVSANVLPVVRAPPIAGGKGIDQVSFPSPRVYLWHEALQAEQLEQFTTTDASDFDQDALSAVSTMLDLWAQIPSKYSEKGLVLGSNAVPGDSGRRVLATTWVFLKSGEPIQLGSKTIIPEAGDAVLVFSSNPHGEVEPLAKGFVTAIDASPNQLVLRKEWQVTE